MRNKKPINITLLILIVFTCFLSSDSSRSEKYFSSISEENKVPVSFVALVASPDEDKEEALKFISKNWEPSFTPMMIEAIYLSDNPAFKAKMVKLLEEKKGQKY